LTCAQKACCGAISPAVGHRACSENASAAKSLILLAFQICAFSGRSSQALDFSGFAGLTGGLYQQSYPQESTQFAKALWNQRLTPVFVQAA
jgi:hypothetical protein